LTLDLGEAARVALDPRRVRVGDAREQHLSGCHRSADVQLGDEALEGGEELGRGPIEAGAADVPRVALHLSLGPLARRTGPSVSSGIATLPPLYSRTFSTDDASGSPMTKMAVSSCVVIAGYEKDST